MLPFSEIPDEQIKNLSHLIIQCLKMQQSLTGV